jgi:hypothetical protein
MFLRANRVTGPERLFLRFHNILTLRRVAMASNHIHQPEALLSLFLAMLPTTLSQFPGAGTIRGMTLQSFQIALQRVVQTGGGIRVGDGD